MQLIDNDDKGNYAEFNTQRSVRQMAASAAFNTESLSKLGKVGQTTKDILDQYNQAWLKLDQTVKANQDALDGFGTKVAEVTAIADQAKQGVSTSQTLAQNNKDEITGLSNKIDGFSGQLKPLEGLNDKLAQLKDLDLKLKPLEKINEKIGKIKEVGDRFEKINTQIRTIVTTNLYQKWTDI